MSSNNVDASGQMRGWFKLIETIRQTDPPCSSSKEFFKPTTNGHPIPIESPQSKSPDVIPPFDVEPELQSPGDYLAFLFLAFLI